MQPKMQISSPQLDMFRNRLESILNHRHELYRLSGHMKTDGKLGRNYLLAELGDKINALLCGAGHNIRLDPQETEGKTAAFFCRIASGPLVLFR